MRSLLFWLIFLASLSLSAGGNSSADDDSFWLNDSNNIVVIPVADLERTNNHRFVFVEVSSVKNPLVLPLAFSLNFSENNIITNLGSFALFPGDNPGKFIVPAQKMINKTGELQIELVLPAGDKGNETVAVEIKNIKLINTLPK